MNQFREYWFRKSIIINIILVFIVVIAGSVVRVTDSGMGCPDWPKCFGEYIPPTNEDQVTWHEDESYHNGQMIIHDEKLFVAQGDFVSKSSFENSNWSEYTKHDYAVYNPIHTWIEFINRLVTVALGFPVIVMVFLSLYYWKDRRARTYLSFVVLFLVGFQAWLGKLVVDRHLEGSTITLHMIGVYAIIGVLLILRDKANREHGETVKPDKSFNLLASISLYITVLMVVVGTQVREQIDTIAKTTVDRMLWIEEVDWMFVLHRSLIYAIIIVNGYLLFKALKNNWYKNKWIIISSIIIVEAFVGVILVYFGFPIIAQPIHLLLSTLLFSFQFDLLIQLRAPKAISYSGN